MGGANGTQARAGVRRGRCTGGCAVAAQIACLACVWGQAGGICVSLLVVVCRGAHGLGRVKEAPESCALTELSPRSVNHTAIMRTELGGDASRRTKNILF